MPERTRRKPPMTASIRWFGKKKLTGQVYITAHTPAAKAQLTRLKRAWKKGWTVVPAVRGGPWLSFNVEGPRDG